MGEGEAEAEGSLELTRAEETRKSLNDSAASQGTPQIGRAATNQNILRM
jgi:hypothetical protein